MARFTGTTRNDTLTGGDGSDLLFGLAGNDSLAGGLGDDVLDGGLGADTMAGGQGSDRYVLDAFGETIVEAANGGRDLVTVRNAAALTTAIDNVEDYIFTGNVRVSFRGSAGDNSITGAAASDTLFGEAGDDVLNGDTGADLLEGGDGSDIYVIDNAGDMVRETTDDILTGGVDLVLSSVSHVLGFGVERLELVGTAAINGTGNDVANSMRGNNAANRLSALGGNDAFDGAGGNDTLDGGLGADTMFGGTGNDIYFVDSFDDIVTEEFSGAKGGIDTVFSSVSFDAVKHVENLTLLGNADLLAHGNELNNRLIGNDGRNILLGLTGNDTIDGGAGDDDISGDDGADLLIGGTGNDTYSVNRDDKIVESVAGLAGGRDRVTFGGAGNFTLGANLEDLEMSRGSTGGATGTGNALDNEIEASEFGNKLFGLVGADTLFGNAGNDTLDGGIGADRMVGGEGDDIYVVDNISDIVVEAIGGSKDDTIRTTLTVMAAVDNVEDYVFLGGAVNFTGNELNNEIIGTRFNDTLIGGGGEDILRGGSGNDLLIGSGFTLDGGVGADTIIGGTGSDSYTVDNIKDVVDESSGAGNDSVSSTVSFSLVANGTTVKGAFEGLFLDGTGNLTGTGNDLDNEIGGNAGANKLFGGLGNDTLAGEKGNDTLDGGAGNDTVVIFSKLDGHDLIQGFDGNAAGGQDVLDLTEFFEDLDIDEVDRASHVQIIDKGSTVEIRIDTSVAGDGVFEYFAATIQTADDITIGSDVLIV